VSKEKPKPTPTPKPNYSDAGKGDKSRVLNKKKFDDNWDKIFGNKKDEKKQN
jgi:hypothetical protein